MMAAAGAPLAPTGPLGNVQRQGINLEPTDRDMKRIRDLHFAGHDRSLSASMGIRAGR
jgi:hypothetical protein